MDYQTPRFGRIFVSFGWMSRMNKLLVLACIFLSACGAGSDRKKSNNPFDQSGQQVDPIQLDPITQKKGSDVYSKYGCFTCHSLDGRTMYGPPLDNLYMKNVSVVREGRVTTIIADRDYLTRAITDPEYEKVSEYEHRIMPVPEIPKEDVETLVDYLIELGKKD